MNFEEIMINQFRWVYDSVVHRVFFNTSQNNLFHDFTGHLVRLTGVLVLALLENGTTLASFHST